MRVLLMQEVYVGNKRFRLPKVGKTDRVRPTEHDLPDDVAADLIARGIARPLSGDGQTHVGDRVRTAIDSTPSEARKAVKLGD